MGQEQRYDVAGTIQDVMASRFSNPDPDNPYVFNGISYAPKTIRRVIDTTDDLMEVIREGEMVRGVDDGEVARISGVPEPRVRRLRTCGDGVFSDLVKVLGALRIELVELSGAVPIGRTP